MWIMILQNKIDFIFEFQLIFMNLSKLGFDESILASLIICFASLFHLFSLLICCACSLRSCVSHFCFALLGLLDVKDFQKSLEIRKIHNLELVKKSVESRRYCIF